MTHHHYEAFVFLEARAVEEPPTCRHAHTHTLFSMEKTDLSEHFVTKQREKSTCNCFFWSWHCKEKKTSNKYINTMFLTSFEFESSLTKRHDHFFFSFVTVRIDFMITLIFLCYFLWFDKKGLQILHRVIFGFNLNDKAGKVFLIVNKSHKKTRKKQWIDPTKEHFLCSLKHINELHFITKYTHCSLFWINSH